MSKTTIPDAGLPRTGPDKRKEVNLVSVVGEVIGKEAWALVSRVFCGFSAFFFVSFFRMSSSLSGSFTAS